MEKGWQLKRNLNLDIEVLAFTTTGPNFSSRFALDSFAEMLA